jgi:anti-anti-sigma factor
MVRRPTLAVVVLDGSATAQILLAGELDYAAEAELDPAVAALLADPQVRRIEIDVALVEFCDSSGLSAFIRAHRNAAEAGIPLRLVRVGSQLRRVLGLTGLSAGLTSPNASPRGADVGLS